MTTQLSTLVGAHVPMVEALTALVDQTEKPKLKVVLVEVKEKVNEGTSLADAMRRAPRRVRRPLRADGARRRAVRRASIEVLDAPRPVHREPGEAAAASSSAAIAYPILLGIVGTFILLGLFLGVIPRIRGMFDSCLGGEERCRCITKVVFFIGDVS